LKKVEENAFVLDIPAHWRLHPVFNVSHLKPSKVDRSREHPPPPQLRSTAAVEYEVEAIREHRGGTVRGSKRHVHSREASAGHLYGVSVRRL